MIKVYTGEALEFQGNIKSTADYIGVGYSTLRKVIGGVFQYLPQKAKCDYIVYNDDKIEKKVLKKDYYEVNVGFKYTVGDLDCEVTNIFKMNNEIRYEINNNFILTPKKPYTKYITIYIATMRYLENVQKNNL